MEASRIEEVLPSLVNLAEKDPDVSNFRVVGDSTTVEVLKSGLSSDFLGESFSEQNLTFKFKPTKQGAKLQKIIMDRDGIELWDSSGYKDFITRDGNSERRKVKLPKVFEMDRTMNYLSHIESMSGIGGFFRTMFSPTGAESCEGVKGPSSVASYIREYTKDLTV